jgi:hypothetical protein
MSRPEVYHRREKQQPQKPPVPAAVEKIAGDQQEAVAPAVRQQPNADEHGREKEQKADRVEKH